MSAVHRRYYGVAGATLGTMRLTGQMFGIGMATLAFGLYGIGKEQITVEHFDGFLAAVRTLFHVFALLCFGGVFASLARGKP